VFGYCVILGVSLCLMFCGVLVDLVFSLRCFTLGFFVWVWVFEFGELCCCRFVVFACF